MRVGRGGGVALSWVALLTACAGASAPPPADRPVARPVAPPAAPPASPEVAAPPATSWVVRLGGPYEEAGTGLAVDGGGNVCVAGTYRYWTDLGAGRVPSLGLRDNFIACYDPAGAYRWSHRFGHAGDDWTEHLVAGGTRVALQVARSTTSTYVETWASTDGETGVAPSRRGGVVVFVTALGVGTLLPRSVAGLMRTALYGEPGWVIVPAPLPDEFENDVSVPPLATRAIGAQALQWITADAAERPHYLPEGHAALAVDGDRLLAAIEPSGADPATLYLAAVRGDAPDWSVPLGDPRELLGAFAGDDVVVAGRVGASGAVAGRPVEEGAFLATFVRATGSLRALTGLGDVAVRGVAARPSGGLALLLEGEVPPRGVEVSAAGGTDLYVIALADPEATPALAAGRAPPDVRTAGAEVEVTFPELAPDPTPLSATERALARALRERARAEHGVDVFPEGVAVVSAPDGRRYVHYSYAYGALDSWIAGLRARGAWEATEARAEALTASCIAERERHNELLETRAEALEARGRQEAADRARSQQRWYDSNGPDLECDGWERLYDEHRLASRCAPDTLVHVVHRLEADGTLGRRAATIRDTTCRIQHGSDLVSVDEAPRDRAPPRAPTVDLDGDGSSEVLSAFALARPVEVRRWTYGTLPVAMVVRVLRGDGSTLAQRRVVVREAVGVEGISQESEAEDSAEEDGGRRSSAHRLFMGQHDGRTAILHEHIEFTRWCLCSEVTRDPDWVGRLPSATAWHVEQSVCTVGYGHVAPPSDRCLGAGPPRTEVVFEARR